MSAGNTESEAAAKRHIDRGELQAAYDLLAEKLTLTSLENYYLAFCFKELHREEPRKAIELFDVAERNGFTGFWLYYHRSLLLAAAGEYERALQDACRVIDQDPLPERIDLALQCLFEVSGRAGVLPESLTNSVRVLVSAIWGHVKDVRTKFAAVNPRILLVDKGDFRAFVYQGDLSAKPTPDMKTLPPSPLTAFEFASDWTRSQDLILFLIAWYVAEGIPTAFLDIGSCIGSDAIRAAKFSRLIGQKFPIASFEPGIMAALVPYNLKLNDVQDDVVFEEKCVSRDSNPTVLFGEFGVSVNNRIVNRNSRTEGFSKIVDAVSVSEYLAKPKFLDRHPILKIDTQGAEWFVWNGMREDVGRRSISMVMELTPWALAPVVQTKVFVRELLREFHIIDIGCSRDRFAPITDETVDEGIANIQRSAPHWSDLLCISRSLPSAHRLIERIASAYR